MNAEESRKALGAIWYHGGPRVDDWSDLKWDRDRTSSSLNAEGPGMYWTSDYGEAATYAAGGGTVYSARLRDGFVFMPRAKPVMRELLALYELADPERRERFLSNWPDASPKKALAHYANQETLFDAYATLYHDLFQYNTEEYVAAMRSLGYDGYVVPRGTTGGSKRREHLILWNVRALEGRQEDAEDPDETGARERVEVDLRGTFFHGTRTAYINALRPSTGGEFGPGIYLTSFEPTAWFYARHVAKGPDEPTVFRVHTAVMHPFRVTKSSWVKMTERSAPSSVQKRLVKQGYDSIVGIANNGYEWQLVVFDPNHVTIVRDPSETGAKESNFRWIEDGVGNGYGVGHRGTYNVAPHLEDGGSMHGWVLFLNKDIIGEEFATKEAAKAAAAKVDSAGETGAREGGRLPRMAHLRDDIIESMARTLFVDSWASQEEEVGRSYPGEDLMRVAPATSAHAMSAAKDLTRKIESMNGKSVAELYGVAIATPGKNYRRPTSEDFGYTLAMMSLGHGVSWFDDHPRFPLRTPHFEYYADLPLANEGAAEDHAADFPTMLDAVASAKSRGATRYLDEHVFWQGEHGDPPMSAKLYRHKGKWHIEAPLKKIKDVPPDAVHIDTIDRIDREIRSREGAAERAPVVHEGSKYLYAVRYIHKISPSDKDVKAPIALTENDRKDRRSLAAALRRQGILSSGDRIREDRTEKDGRVIVFPAASIWWSIILTPTHESASEAREAGPFATSERNVDEMKAGKKIGQLGTSRAVYDLLHVQLEKERQEVFLCIPLNIRGEPCCPPVEIARGQVDRVSVATADVMAPIIQHNASGAIICHNHPSGNATPSQADRDLTKSIKKAMAAGTPGTVMLDHVVIGVGQYYSITEDRLYKV